MKTIQYLPISDIKPHPLNASIYGDGADKDLLESVKKIGIMSPIVVTKKLIIISGHRRHNAALMAGFSEMPCIISDVDESDQLAVEELLIEANTQRQKTHEQIAREYTRLKEIEEEKAKKRQQEAGEKFGIGKEIASGEFTGSYFKVEKGESREIAAKKLGIGAQKAERAAKVVHHVDNLRSEGKTEEAEQLRQTLNQKSVNAAYQAMKAKKEPPQVIRYIDEDLKEEETPETKYFEVKRIDEGFEKEDKALQDRIKVRLEEQITSSPDLEAENAKLRDRIEELEKELESERFSLNFFRNISPAEYKKIKAENEALSARINEIEKENAILKAENTSANEEIERLKKKIETLEEELEENEDYQNEYQNAEYKENNELKKALLEKIKELEELKKRDIIGEIRCLSDYNDKLISNQNTLQKDIETLRKENEILKRQNNTSLSQETKPVQIEEIQEKEIWQSKKGVLYWFENRENAWVIMKKDDQEECEWNTFETKEKAQAKMKITIKANKLRKEGSEALIESIDTDKETRKLAEKTQELELAEKNQELEHLRKQVFDMGREIMDKIDEINNLKESLSPKARDFQEQERKIKKLDKENQAIYDEFNKFRSEFNSLEKRNKYLTCENQMLKDDVKNLKKDMGIEDIEDYSQE